MSDEKKQATIEAILFSAGKEVEIKELMGTLELSEQEIKEIVEKMKEKYEQDERGIEIIKVGDAYQLSTKTELYEYIYPIIDKRSKPTLSQAALEIISIIAYNPKITKPEIEAIRGVNCDGTIYKLLEYNLVEIVGKADAPGKPLMYEVTKDFFRLFGFTSLEDLPELPKYKLDENEQVVVDEK